MSSVLPRRRAARQASAGRNDRITAGDEWNFEITARGRGRRGDRVRDREERLGSGLTDRIARSPSVLVVLSSPAGESELISLGMTWEESLRERAVGRIMDEFTASDLHTLIRQSAELDLHELRISKSPNLDMKTTLSDHSMVPHLVQ